MSGIGNIDHFVVLMLENRSFDHMFGLRRGVKGLLDDDFANADAKGRRVKATGGAPYAIPTRHGLGPFHNLVDVNLQLFGTKTPPAGAAPDMSGFVQSYVEALQDDTRGEFTDADVDVVMKSFDVGALASLSQLADEFVLCDQWFSEVPGPTHPNRLYMHAGTSAGFVHNVFNRDFDQVTIYELLRRNKRSWAVYDFDLNEVKHFTRIADETDNFRRYTPHFAQDVESGDLPNYSFVLPRFNGAHHAEANDQHAPRDLRWGEELIADLYDTLRASPQIWNKCALIITYDEHGGFFDHVVPPAAVNPDGISSPRPDDNFHNAPPPAFAFDRLGLRVPALIVSPWVARGRVLSEQLQHTSILHTVRERFGIAQALTAREAAAASFAAVFDQAAPRETPAKLNRPKNMPSLAPIDHHANPGNRWPDPLPREMIAGVLHATRPSHPGDAATPPQIPTNAARVSELADSRWSQHRRWQNENPRRPGRSSRGER